MRMALEKFWAPVPWMLEAAIVVELALGKYVEAGIIALLLVFNAALGLFQESRAQATLTALKSRLALTASVQRDGAWKTVPATEVVPGDVVKLSLGAVVAADVKLTGDEVLFDQSMLTGESVPIEARAGVQTYAGALVRRGEAEAEVTATGARTKFGRTAELVRTAHVVSTQQTAVLRVVRNLAAFNGAVIVLLVTYAWYIRMPVTDIIPLVLTAILASIPVALPATFTLASALGARALAKRGVLPTRLSAVDEAASMVVLCADKTGTLTQNALTVTTVRPMPGFDEAHVLALAALASSDGGQDPVDGAIRTSALRKAVSDAPKLIKFDCFDPAKKMSEATATDATGGAQRIVKGAFAAVIGLVQPSQTAVAAAKELEDKGFRVLAVAAGPTTAMKLVGLIALSGRSRRLFSSAAIPLRDLPPSRISMINGSKSSARAVARRLRPSLPTRRASSKCAVGEFLLPPQTTPRAFDATIAALTRSEMSLASYSAIAARIWIVSRFACGKSAATNSTPLSMSCEIKATLRARRSSFAITKTALNMRQSLSASLNCERAAFLPLSTSVNSANNSPEVDSRNLLTAACWASSPSPDRPCARGETR